MKLRELRLAISDILLCASNSTQEQKFLKQDMEAYFNFPLKGAQKRYRILKVDKDGIMLDNDTVDKPSGHEA